VCDNTSSQSAQLTMLVSTPAHDMPVQCTVCGEVLAGSSSLQIHMIRHKQGHLSNAHSTPGRTQTSYHCSGEENCIKAIPPDQDNQYFTSADNACHTDGQHNNTVFGMKAYADIARTNSSTCLTNSQNTIHIEDYVTSAKPVSHVDSHGLENAHVCDLSAKASYYVDDLVAIKTSNILIMDMEVNSSHAKIYAMLFNKSDIIANHAMTSVRETSFKCQICDKVFQDVTSIYQHMRIISCICCNLEVTCYTAFKLHMSTHFEYTMSDTCSIGELCMDI